jgi:SAM-dependent methyltransferase
VSYAAKTFADRNPVKRFVQGRRLRDAVHLAQSLPDPDVIVDFGAGNGELCKRLVRRFPAARIICYEPHPELIQQARANLESIPGVEFCTEASELPRAGADLVFCLEVFEHLPPAESGRVLDQLEKLLRGGGRAILGVPIETGLPALYKGAFRMARRYGEFDARPGHVFGAMAGRPPAERPVVELLPGSHYHLHHMGFDHRVFRRQLLRRFEIEAESGSPFPWLGHWINSEFNVLVGLPGGRSEGEA